MYRWELKSRSYQTNNKFPGKDGLTAEFHEHFSNELAHVLLDVYDFWGKLFYYLFLYMKNMIPVLEVTPYF